jgi:cyclin-dependent kinase-like
MNKYELLETIGEGAYGIVIKARNKETGELVAIKRFKESEEDEMVRKTTLREVKILRALKEEQYIVRLNEAFRRKGRLYLVFEYVGKNLHELLEEQPNGVPEKELRRMIFAVLLSMRSCHANGIIHRDIKPENLLVHSVDGTLRLCDFGFARPFTAGMNDLTDYVATRWYRSPELLLGTSDYGLPSDLWAVGCIMAELIDGQPLFPGERELDQMHLIQKLLGNFTDVQNGVFARNTRFAGSALLQITRTETTLDRKFGKRLSKPGLALLRSLLVIDPAQRLSATEALQHPYFEGLAMELCPQLATSLCAPAPPVATRPSSVPKATTPVDAGAGDHVSSQPKRRTSANVNAERDVPVDGSMPALGRPQSSGLSQAPLGQKAMPIPEPAPRDQQPMGGGYGGRTASQPAQNVAGRTAQSQLRNMGNGSYAPGNGSSASGSGKPGGIGGTYGSNAGGTLSRGGSGTNVRRGVAPVAPVSKKPAPQEARDPLDGPTSYQQPTYQQQRSTGYDAPKMGLPRLGGGGGGGGGGAMYSNGGVNPAPHQHAMGGANPFLGGGHGRAPTQGQDGTRRSVSSSGRGFM